MYKWCIKLYAATSFSSLVVSVSKVKVSTSTYIGLTELIMIHYCVKLRQNPTSSFFKNNRQFSYCLIRKYLSKSNVQVKCQQNLLTSTVHRNIHSHHHIVVALSVECRTCDQEVVGSSLGRARGVKTLGKFLTPVCLCSPSSTS